MKQKKANKLFKKIDYFLLHLVPKEPHLHCLDIEQRLALKDYMKQLLVKENKKVSPNLEALKENINPTFTQPKEVGCSALYNGVVRVVNFNEKDVSGTQFYGVGKVISLHK